MLKWRQHSVYDPSGTFNFKFENVLFAKKNLLYVWGLDGTNLSLKITICHHSSSHVMLIGDHLVDYFYPTLLMIDSYQIVVLKDKRRPYLFNCEQEKNQLYVWR